MRQVKLGEGKGGVRGKTGEGGVGGTVKQIERWGMKEGEEVVGRGKGDRGDQNEGNKGRGKVKGGRGEGLLCCKMLCGSYLRFIVDGQTRLVRLITPDPPVPGVECQG